MQILQSLPDPCLLEILSFIGNYHELIQLGFEEFITRYPRCVTEVNFRDNTIPKNYVENARKVTVKCIGYNLPPLLNCGEFYCCRNQLTYLPDLPNCKTLNCDGNQLTFLPDLPECRILECLNNQLTFLPDLPCHENLVCSDNQLTYLPDLLECRELYCDNNQLTSLPDLPECRFLNC
jgi:hypothetical protein